jgi:hypothetical protein
MFQRRRGLLVRGVTIVRRLRPTIAVSGSFRGLCGVGWWRVGATLLRPVEHLVAVVDDAAAVAAGGWPFAAPAQVVERAPLDAQELGCLVDREKGRVVIVEHEGVLQSFDVVNVCDL